jgi:hypothetical protein
MEVSDAEMDIVEKPDPEAGDREGSVGSASSRGPIAEVPMCSFRLSFDVQRRLNL